MKSYRKPVTNLELFQIGGMLEGPMYSYGRMGCLWKNVKIKVISPNGKISNKKIADLHKIFYVLSYNFKSKKIEKKLARKVKSNIKNGLKLTFENASFIIASGKHKFFNRSGNLVKTKDLEIGSKLLRGQANKKDNNFLKIVKIEKIKNIEMWDIQVEDNNNFFLSNSILSQNSGKSCSFLSIIQGYHDVHGYKIVDIHGGERHEGLYWTIPSQDTSYWTKLGAIGRFDEEGPKQYKVNLLYPYFEGKLPKKLPKKPLYVNSKLFTIPIKTLTLDDISMVIGVPSEASKYAFNEFIHGCTKKTTSGSMMDVADGIKGLKNTPFYKNFLLPLSRENFLMDNYCDYNIDMTGEMRDREAITVLCLDFVPKEFHLLVMNYLCRITTELLDSNKIGKKNIIFMREAATFFRATEDSVLDDRFKIFRTLMSHYIRMGRRGQYFCLDCQSASETRGLVEGAADFLLIFNTTSYRDKEELTKSLIAERRVRRDQVADFAFLEKGQCYVVEARRNAKKIQILLPRTMYWKKDYGNFYRNVWEKYGGEWEYTEKVKDYIEEKNKIIKKPIPMKEEIVALPKEFKGEGIMPEEIAPPPLGEKFELPKEVEEEVKVDYTKPIIPIPKVPTHKPKKPIKPKVDVDSLMDIF